MITSAARATAMASGETMDVYAAHLVRQRVRVGGTGRQVRCVVRSARRDRRGKGGDDGGTFRVGIDADVDDASGTLNKANNAFASLAGLKSSLPSARTEPQRAEPSAEKTTTKSGGDEKTTSTNQLRLPVRVSSSRAGRRGKTVTVVRGAFPRDADARKALLRALKSALGVGGALGVDDDTAAEIVLQGDVVDLVVDALRARGHVDVKRAG